MISRQILVLIFLCTFASSFSWPWQSGQSTEAKARVKRSYVNCKNIENCFKCDEIKRKGQCSGYMALCAMTCNPACASTSYMDQPYKPCALIKSNGQCSEFMPYSKTNRWFTVCEKSCCVLEKPPRWGPWSAWGPCTKTCHAGLKSRTRHCIGAGFGQTCSGSLFQTAKCNENVPCKGLVGWAKTSVTVNEDVGTVTIKIKRSRKTDCEASLKVNTKDGTAKQPDDYTRIENLVVKFAKEETEKSVTFTINKDKQIEPLESFTAIITADPHKLDVNPAVTTINIKDYTSTIEIRPVSQKVKEPSKIAKVTVERKGCLLGTTTVCIYTVAGTAKPPGDYVAISKQNVVFAPKETSKEVSITIVNDGVEEKQETFYVVLGCAGPSVAITAGKAAVTIEDDDVDGGWSEWGSYGGCSKSCAGGSQSRTRTCTNPKPQGGGKKCAGYPTSTQYCNTQRCPAKVGLKPTSISKLENVREVEVEVFRIGNSIGTNKCQVSTVAGSAKPTEDFVGISNKEIVFKPGDASKKVSIDIVNDKVLEGTESFKLKLTCNDPGVKEVKPDTTVIEILDDDVQVLLHPAAYKVREPDGSVTLTVKRKGYLKNPNTAVLNTCDETAVAPGDYKPLKDVVVKFAPSETSQKIKVIIEDDKLVEPTETFCVKLTTTDPKVSVVNPKKAVVSIEDNDATVEIRPVSQKVKEPSKIAKVTVDRKGYLLGKITVCISTVAGTAKAPGDYVAISKQNVVFAPKETSKEVSITIVNDGVEEKQETFYVVLGCAGPSVAITVGKAAVTIEDDDVDGGWSEWGSYGGCSKSCAGGSQSRTRTCTNPKPQGGGKKCAGYPTSTQYCNTQRCPAKVGLKPTSISKLENVGKVEVEVFRIGNSIGTNKCQVSTVAGSAKPTEDFVGISNKEIVFKPGDAFIKVSIVIVNDKVLEGTESFKLKLTCKDPGVKEVKPDTTVIEILDDDVQVLLHPAAYSVRETDGSVTLTVKRKGYLKNPNTAVLNTCDETAVAPGDYKPLKDVVVKFAPSETSQTVKVTIVDDKVLEKIETFCVKLTTTDPKVSVVDPKKAVVSIEDNDAVISLERAQYCVLETVGTLKVKITRTGALNFEHTGVLNSQDGTAVAPGDYDKISALDIKFAAKQAEQEITVTIKDDNKEEAVEKFKLALSTGDPRVTVKTDQATIIVTDNDVDGRWSPWSEWGACGKACGQSTQSRSRVCDPAPQGGGKKCVGAAKESRACYIVQNCPVNGGWSDWGKYGKCSCTCGGGYQTRARTCTNPSPKYGGKPCVGTLVEVKDCNSKCCPVNGQWSYWDKWSDCDKSTNKRTRKRKCNSPAPSCGGKGCAGGAAAAVQTKDCEPVSPCGAYVSSDESQLSEDQNIE